MILYFKSYLIYFIFFFSLKNESSWRIIILLYLKFEQNIIALGNLLVIEKVLDQQDDTNSISEGENDLD